MLARNLILITGILVLGACAATPQPPIAMNMDALNQSSKVAVVFKDVPEPKLTLPGADCLLCIAAASAANSGLSGVVKAYSVDEVEDLKPLLIAKLEEAGNTVVVIDDLDEKKLPKFKSDTTGFAKRDLREVGDQYGAGHVLVVNLNHVGATRPYASYIPTGQPYAAISGLAYAVDLTDNSYAWYEPIGLQMQPEGDWKEGPEYHNVTNAFYRLVEQLRDQLTGALTQTDSEVQPLAEGSDHATVVHTPNDG